MAQNRTERAHAPAYLQNLAIGFTPRGLVADTVCPRTPVAKQSDKYRVYGKQLFQEREGKRAPGAAPVEILSDYSSDQYFADVYALRHPLFDEELNNADADLNLRMRYTEVTTMAMAIMREKRVASLFTTPANFAATHSVLKAAGQEWDTVPGNVITDIETALNTVSDDASVPLDMVSLVIPETVFRKAIKNNANYLERIKYSERGIVLPDLMAAVHGCKEVIIAAARSIPLPEKVQSDITSPATQALWGDNVWAGVIGTRDDQLLPKFALSFNWTTQTNGEPRAVYEYRDGDAGKKTTWIEVEEAIGEKITAKDAGYLIRNTLA